MRESDRITDPDDDSALDGLLSTLTEPGEDPAFRARVLAQIDRTAVAVARSRRTLRALAGASLAATVVAGAFVAWRASGPVPSPETATRFEAPLPSTTEHRSPRSAAVSDHDAVARRAGEDEVPRPASTRQTTARAVWASPSQVMASREPSAEEEPLPYGMQRIRLEPVSIRPFALREVREDPALAALTPPDPVRVDPIDIEEIAPRR